MIFFNEKKPLAMVDIYTEKTVKDINDTLFSNKAELWPNFLYEGMILTLNNSKKVNIWNLLTKQQYAIARTVLNQR